jgi:large subunit ribosomal protein L3
MLKSIIGEKVCMTQVFDSKGYIIPVTVVKAGPCVVTAVRTNEKDGYSAIQLGFRDVDEKYLSKPRMGFFRKNNISPKKIIREFRVADTSVFFVGQEIKADVFKIGDYVDVSGITKGKGYAGVIKRHNFGMQPKTHGQSDRTRARGSSGGQGAQRVLKGTKMSGHLGCEYVTIQRLLIVDIDVEKNVLLIKGSVPAINTGTLVVASTLKKVPIVQEIKISTKKK